ncbi:hypothetical protein BDQ17DRAFT_129330 [Cyathus striatus]|nr:hypothetical protein BDQ17DRAFT_129330 [Cyathus striatus]
MELDLISCRHQGHPLGEQLTHAMRLNDSVMTAACASRFPASRIFPLWRMHSCESSLFLAILLLPSFNDCFDSYSNTFTPTCECSGVQSILVDAFIRGLGILLIFMCVWFLLRWFVENKNRSHIRASNSRSKLQPSSRVSSIHKHDLGRASKEYKDADVQVIASPAIVPGANDTRGGVDSTHVVPIFDKGGSAIPNKKSTPLPPEPSDHDSISGESMASVYGGNEGFQSPISVALQAAPAPPQERWTPHSDVSKATRFAATPAVLLPPE